MAVLLPPMSHGGGSSDTECFTSSVSLWKEWRKCCYQAMGLEDYDDDTNEDDDAKHRSRGSFDSARSPSIVRTVGDITIVNLLTAKVKTPTKEASYQELPHDPWLQTAQQIHNNIGQMRSWIHAKQIEYVSVDLDDNEASLIQSTVTSFAATTANEIECLRQLLLTASSSTRNNNSKKNSATTSNAGDVGNGEDKVKFCHGVVQSLLSDLQEYVVQPFAKLQKQRSRSAIRIWRHPLECSFAILPTSSSSTSSTSSSPQHHRPRDVRFYPTRPTLKLQTRVWESYQESLLQYGPQQRRSRPTTRLVRNHKTKRDEESGDDDNNSSTSSPSHTRSKTPNQKRFKSSIDEEGHNVHTPVASTPAASSFMGRSLYSHTSNTSNQHRKAVMWQEEQEKERDSQFTTTSSDILEREAAQLLLVAQSTNELDHIQQMEAHMVQITTLLSQFANLVSMQQEEVQQIHDTTHEAHDYVDQGQEQLVRAKEATESSRHYMASAITLMTMLLWIFHWVRP